MSFILGIVAILPLIILLYGGIFTMTLYSLRRIENVTDQLLNQSNIEMPQAARQNIHNMFMENVYRPVTRILLLLFLVLIIVFLIFLLEAILS